MKIDIGESLCYSYLRHVKGCWLVQTNWKSSEHWAKYKADAELDTMFREMRLRFDVGGTVFKQTASVGQFMQQAEIDVVGIDQVGSIHAMDVAFHEAGLNYGGGAANRVLKKLLRTYLLLSAYHPSETAVQIYFVSPKVHKAVQAPLENIFAALQEQYPEVGWHLMTNEICHEEVVLQTLDKAESVADTAELFVRASKLLNSSAATRAESYTAPPIPNAQSLGVKPVPPSKIAGTHLQDLVRGLMRTLLDECPTILDDADLNGFMDSQYCKNVLSLKIGNQALLRDRRQGREVSGHSRYWSHVYGGRFYVCSQWWKDDHPHNANSLLKFLSAIERRKPDHPDIAAIDRHLKLLRDFVAGEPLPVE